MGGSTAQLVIHVQGKLGVGLWVTLCLCWCDVLWAAWRAERSWLSAGGQLLIRWCCFHSASKLPQHMMVQVAATLLGSRWVGLYIIIVWLLRVATAILLVLTAWLLLPCYSWAPPVCTPGPTLQAGASVVACGPQQRNGGACPGPGGRPPRHRQHGAGPQL